MEKFSSYVHVLHETLHQEVSRRSCAVDVKELYLKASCKEQSCCFAHKTNRFLTLSLSWLLTLPIGKETCQDQVQVWFSVAISHVFLR